MLILTKDDELNDQKHSRWRYIPLNAETADLSRSGTLSASFAGPRPTSRIGQKFAMIVVVALDKCEQRKKELEKQIAKLTAN